jgi:hypothetical protein
MKAHTVIQGLGLLVVCALGGCSHLVASHRIAATKFVTAGDAARILGGKVSLSTDTSGEAENSPGRIESACVYTGPDGAELDAVFDADPSEAIARATHDQTREYEAQHGGVQDEPGIGDEAYLSRGPASVKIHVRKGKVGFLVSVIGGRDTQATVDELENLAKKVAGDL